MAKQKIGLVGLAVMGENLALNIERNGFSMAVFNRTTAKTGWRSLALDVIDAKGITGGLGLEAQR